ncbi:type II toxin-antitoxin system VapC family toxin [Staphylococcus chromogenes]|nr:type II toxin-antitoxin system VapC family toxin [Staphylococcus chromogenes]
MIIADTSVVSEFMRPNPAAHVVDWASSISAERIGVSAITVQEIETGLMALPESRRKHELFASWSKILAAHAGRVVTYGLEEARATARVISESKDMGRQMSLADAQIAGICMANGYQLATRNVKDFVHVAGLEVVNPF